MRDARHNKRWVRRIITENVSLLSRRYRLEETTVVAATAAAAVALAGHGGGAGETRRAVARLLLIEGGIFRARTFHTRSRPNASRLSSPSPTTAWSLRARVLLSRRRRRAVSYSRTPRTLWTTLITPSQPIETLLGSSSRARGSRRVPKTRRWPTTRTGGRAGAAGLQRRRKAKLAVEKACEYEVGKTRRREYVITTAAAAAATNRLLRFGTEKQR